MSSKATEAISKGIDTSTKNFGLFIPSLGPIIVHLIFLILAYVVFPYRYQYGFYPFIYEIVVPNPYLIWGGYFIASIIGFIAFCIIVDMTNDIINGLPMNMSKSMKVVTGRLGTLLVASIISAIFFLLFFLIPFALFIVVIAIIEGTSAIESTKRSFDFVIKNLGEVVIFVIIVIVVAIIVGIGFALIPVVGAYIGAIIHWIIEVIFIAAAVHLYLSLRQAIPPPPPPPPPT
jgi:MFS family permease